MLDGDRLCRAVPFPKFITNGVFDEEALLNFQQTTDGIYAMSVASRFLARSEAGVHAYGESVAAAMNARFEQQNLRPPKPMSEEVHYLGFYEFTHGDLVTIGMDHYTLGCRWVPENGQDVHFQAEMYPKSSGSRRERRNDRTAAVGVLFARLKGPWRHIAAKDIAHKVELESIDLPLLKMES